MVAVCSIVRKVLSVYSVLSACGIVVAEGLESRLSMFVNVVMKLN